MYSKCGVVSALIVIMIFGNPRPLKAGDAPLRATLADIVASESADNRSILKIRADLILPPEVTQKQPRFLCIMPHPKIRTLVLDGKTIENPGELQFQDRILGWKGMGAERKTPWIVYFWVKGVPQAKTITKIEADLTIVREIKPITLEWKLPAELDQARSADKLSFKISNGRPDFGGRWIYVTPTPNEAGPAPRVMWSELLGDDNKPVTSRSGLPLVLLGAQKSVSFTYQDMQSASETFRLMVPEVGIETVPVVIENVEIPANKTLGANVPQGPRGATTIQSDGFSISLDSIAVNSSNPKNPKAAQLQLKFLCKGSQQPAPASVSFVVKNVRGVTDTGEVLEWPDEPFVESTYQSLKWEGQIRLQRSLDYAIKPAERFVTLSGVISPLLYATEWTEKTIEVPAGAKSREIAEGPVKLSLEYQEKELVFELRMDDAAFPTKHRGWNDVIEVACHEAGGRDLVKERSSVAPGGGQAADSFVRVKCNRTDGAYKITVKYPKKGTVKDLKFEFKDVGLPRKGAAPKPDRNDF
jgi:hypothetical protein